ncbi:hypothetical protein MCAMS1_01179 [biofilm metagenome]
MTNLGIITTIVVTSALSVGGTYYLTTQDEPASGQEEKVVMERSAPIAALPQPQLKPNQHKPASVPATANTTNIVVHTHVAHKQREKTKTLKENLADVRRAVYGQQPEFNTDFK